MATTNAKLAFENKLVRLTAGDRLKKELRLRTVNTSGPQHRLAMRYYFRGRRYLPKDEHSSLRRSKVWARTEVMVAMRTRQGRSAVCTLTHIAKGKHTLHHGGEDVRRDEMVDRAS